MLEKDDIPDILRYWGVEYKSVKMTDDLAIYEVPLFGVRVIWSVSKYEASSTDWNSVVAYPLDEVRDVRERIVWALAKCGFFYYLRSMHPSTFKKMLAGREGEDWHRKIIKKRLEGYGTDPKYRFLRELNEDKLNQSSIVILGNDPGFYDFV